ncbi:MAG: ABC transporter permease [Planctomycetota bacterium]
MKTRPMAQTLTLFEMAIRGVRFRWRSTVALALGVATAVTVIVGALLVGDSMRGSLRQLTLERLGKIETMILPGGFFESEGLVDPSVRSEPLIWFPSGVVEAKRDDGSGIIRRAGSVQIVASDPTFWELDTADIRPKATPGFDEVILNEAAARELDVAIGDNVTVRLPVEGAVPADSPLGRRDATTEGLPRLKVIDILPNRGLGRFAVIPNQATPKTAFLARSLVADTLERDGQANAIVSPSPLTMDQINVDLADTGMKLQRVRQSFGDDDETVFQYDCLTSDRLLLPEAVVDRLQDSSTSDGTSAAPIMTYLANAIEKLDDDGNVVASTVYGTVTAADSSDGLPLDYTLPDDGDSDRIPLVINSWTAEKLDAEVGTPLRIAYYEPEVEAGNEIERYADAIVTQIVPITRPAKPFRGNRPAVYETRPTLYNDPDLTPTVPGVTDQESMDRWDTPFELTRTIDRPDDTYYKDHRLTSKAFMPLADGRRLFASRFGQTTGLRFSTTSKVSPEGNVSPALASRIDRELEDLLPELGWTVIPVRQQQLDASRGTTPFDALFLSLSFFVILASVLLIAMLMRLSLTQRLKQLGTLLAVGWTPSRVRRLVVGESLLVAAFGGVVGIAGGVAYAQFILWALRSWWVGAVTVPFLSFHWSVGSVLIGLLVGWGIAAITLTLIARRLLRTPPTDLLGGRTEASTGAETNTKRRSFGWQKPLMVATAIAAMGLAAFSAVSGGQAAAGGFVGAGMLLLGTFLLAIDARLRRPRRIGGEGGQPFSVGQLSSRNATRNPTRSTLSIALMATAAFLIVAMGAFRLQPTRRGTGGFDLMGQSSQPLFRDLADSKIQANLLGIDADALADSQILPLRLRPGQDASCNNLYQATRPTVLGIPQRFSQLVSSDDRFGFDFVGGMDPASSPWVQLEESARGHARRPCSCRHRPEHRDVEPSNAWRCWRSPFVRVRCRQTDLVPRRWFAFRVDSAGQTADWRDEF